MKMLLAPLIAMSVFTACARAKNNTIATTPLPEKTILNVPYGPDSLQRFDLYLPANRSAAGTPLLVLLHGGGWAGGDKMEFAAVIPVLKKKLPQYAIANVNYRLANQITNHFPTQEKDVQAALARLMKEANDYQISTNVVLLGASAGAHLALLQAYKYATPVVPKAVISFFGPTDLTELYNRQSNAYYRMGLQLLIGGTPQTKPEAFAQTSPVYFAAHQHVPTLLLHGANDALVPVSQSKALYQKLQAANVPSELIVYPTEGHGWQGANLTDAYDRIVSFLNAHVHGAPAQ